MAGDRLSTPSGVLIPHRFLRVKSWVDSRLSDSRKRRYAFAHVIGFCATNLETLVGPADMEEEAES